MPSAEYSDTALNLKVGKLKNFYKMKKTHLMLSLLVIFIFSACNKKAETEELIKPENLQFSFLNDNETVIKISSSLSSFINSIHQIDPNIIMNEVDFNKSFIASEKGQIGEALGVNLKTRDTEIIYTFMLVRNGDKIGSPKLVAIENRKSIKYYDLESGTLLHLIIHDNKVEVMNSRYSHVNFQQRVFDCGQATANCIADAYSNHGWTSVWLGIQSAFLPQTAVAIAAACAAKNCL
ncbi:MAG: hypothetical protein K2Q24_00715 [Chitinophagaceae bacterium]|nr:hypothetical protein [Chitinophagaceae bacterium]